MNMSRHLLDWYDTAARDLPWRIGPQDRAKGVRPDPYRVWLSEIMLQQTTVAAVKGYYRRFLALWPDVGALAAAQDDDVMAKWAGLGYYARARNLLKCARTVAAGGGVFPDTEAELMALPGIGPYTAAAIAAIAFDRPAVVVDGNVERVIARLHALDRPIAEIKPIIREHAADITPQTRPGDHAQAMMDLGATICTPRNPACMVCPLRAGCAAHAAGRAAELPVKAKRQPKPERRGTIYVGWTTHGDLVLERRPDKGLLGGMLGFPGSAWTPADEEPALDVAPSPGTWRRAAAPVVHVFTHFRLTLDVMVATGLAPDALPGDAVLAPAGRFASSDLPTVMRKALDRALETCAAERAAE